MQCSTFKAFKIVGAYRTKFLVPLPGVCVCNVKPNQMSNFQCLFCLHCQLTLTTYSPAMEMLQFPNTPQLY